jgi:hypothetical protein
MVYYGNEPTMTFSYRANLMPLISDIIDRQLLQDDKGTVAIICFGLPYLSHEDDALRGVMTALHVKKALANQVIYCYSPCIL